MMTMTTEERPSLLGPWTNVDAQRAQRRSYALLGQFLGLAKMPVITWRVSEWSLTSIVLRVDGDQRAIVQAWANELGLKLEVHTLSDHVRVIATGKKPIGRGDKVSVSIWADIYPDADVES